MSVSELSTNEKFLMSKSVIKMKEEVENQAEQEHPEKGYICREIQAVELENEASLREIDKIKAKMSELDGLISRGDKRAYDVYPEYQTELFKLYDRDYYLWEKRDYLEQKLEHKEIYANQLHCELFQYHHKRRYFIDLENELMPITWHPDRVIDWCFDEDQKRDLKKLWN